MSVKVRFAPSPTGKLHVGNVRTALMNVLFARNQGGQVLLRIDDTDLKRSMKVFEDALKADLTWLGLGWDETFNQSTRFDRYDAAKAKLIEKDLLYPCYETGKELERKRRIQRTRGRPPVYDRAALLLTDEDKVALEAEGRRPYWRFKLSGGRIEWNDLVRGPSHIETGSVSDPVLIRADGGYLYTLPSVVDDLDADITHIIRGEDHVTNSAVQIEIFEALGGRGAAPDMGHTALLVGADGDKLSKRLGGLSIEELRDHDGLEAMAVVSLLAKIGTSDAVDVCDNLQALADGFDLSRLSRTPARFDIEELKRLNARLVHTMSYVGIQPRLAAMDADCGETFWLTVRPNLTVVKDVLNWWALIVGPVTPIITREDLAFIAKAAETLPGGELDCETWKAWTGALSEMTGRRGRTLFRPLRLALTGQEHGPEMAALLPLMGADKIRRRLGGETV